MVRYITSMIVLNETSYIFILLTSHSKSGEYECYSYYHTRLCAYHWFQGVCAQVWNAQVKGQVTETHRLKVNSYCDTALFISIYDITMAQT